jgi:hypothetical protein
LGGRCRPDHFEAGECEIAVVIKVKRKEALPGGPAELLR